MSKVATSAARAQGPSPWDHCIGTARTGTVSEADSPDDAEDATEDEPEDEWGNETEDSIAAAA